MSVFKKASFNRLFSLLIIKVISLYKIRFFGAPLAAASEEKEKLGTPQTPAESWPPSALPLVSQLQGKETLIA